MKNENQYVTLLKSIEFCLKMKAVSSFDDYVVLFYHMRLSLLYLKEKMKWNPPSLDGGLNLGLFSVSNK